MKNRKVVKRNLSVLYFIVLFLFLCGSASFGEKEYVEPKKLLGDVNSDNVVSAEDARLILRASVGLEILSVEKIRLANVDNDRAISAADARLVLRASVGLEKLDSDLINDSSKPYQLTNQEASALWMTANRVYAGWLVKPLPPIGEGIVDENEFFLYNGRPYYRVIAEGIHSKQQLIEYLSLFFEPSAYSYLFSFQRFIEKDGNLYILVMGIGECGLDAKNICVKSQNDENAMIELTAFNVFIGEEIVIPYKLHYRDGKWRFSGQFICCYNDLHDTNIGW